MSASNANSPTTLPPPNSCQEIEMGAKLDGIGRQREISGELESHFDVTLKLIQADGDPIDRWKSSRDLKGGMEAADREEEHRPRTEAGP